MPKWGEGMKQGGIFNFTRLYAYLNHLKAALFDKLIMNNNLPIELLKHQKQLCD